jgi:hypothetical protein
MQRHRTEATAEVPVAGVGDSHSVPPFSMPCHDGTVGDRPL